MKALVEPRLLEAATNRGGTFCNGPEEDIVTFSLELDRDTLNDSTSSPVVETSF